MLTINRESEPHFKLDIRSEPIQEEDSDAQSALSNVANTLRAVSIFYLQIPRFSAHTHAASTAGGYATQAYCESGTERREEHHICAFTANA